MIYKSLKIYRVKFQRFQSGGKAMKIKIFKGKGTLSVMYICLHVKTTKPDLQRYSQKLCLTKYELDINVFSSF